MNRITATFLILLAVATFASGQLWMQSRLLASAPITGINLAVILGSATVLLISLTGLGRMLYRTAQLPVTISSGEEKDA